MRGGVKRNGSGGRKEKKCHPEDQEPQEGATKDNGEVGRRRTVGRQGAETWKGGEKCGSCPSNPHIQVHWFGRAAK